MSIKSSSVGSRQKVDSTPGKEVRNDGRAIMSRLSETSVLILKNLTAGKTANGCLVCCNSPSCCAICSVCPCCDYSEYLVKRRESSKYIHIRENSIEWNTPEISMRSGNCFGIDPCIFDVKDNVEVIYYDDPIFSRLKNTTRLCNEFRTCFCGGRGERIQLSSNCCFGMGYRGSCLCPCIPVCCPAGTLNILFAVQCSVPDLHTIVTSHILTRY